MCNKEQIKHLENRIQRLEDINRELVLRVLENDSALRTAEFNFRTLLRVAVVDLSGVNGKEDVDSYFDLRFRGGANFQHVNIGKLIPSRKEKR